MEIKSIKEELNSLAYHGRGIMIGKSTDGKKAVMAYFIMGRSENSRNRVFVEDGEGIRTQAFDESKMVDPHLIIYAPVRVLGNKTIVTNGDQTDTIYELMDKQMTFEQALRTREFEDDAPNFTPRISGIIHIDNGVMNYAMSILKSQTATAALVRDTPMRIKIHSAVKQNLSTLINATEIPFRALKVSRKRLSFPTRILILLQSLSGKISTRTTRFRFS